MTKRLVITDFDGTLLNDKKNIPEKNLETLERLRKQGIRVAIATGRSMASFGGALSDMQLHLPVHALPLDYILFSTGSGIMTYPSGKILFQRSMPFRDVARIAHYFDERKIDYMIHKAIPQTNHLLYKSHGGVNRDFHMRLSIYNTHASPLEIFVDQFESVTEVLAILPVNYDRQTVNQIRKDLAGFSVIPATSPLDHRSLWIEVFHKDVSKSAAAAWLCRYLGIDKKDVIAVGNDYNDKDLLTWAQTGYVVENAPAHLKNRFATVGSNNDSGFAGAVADSGFLNGIF